MARILDAVRELHDVFQVMRGSAPGTPAFPRQARRVRQLFGAHSCMTTPERLARLDLTLRSSLGISVMTTSDAGLDILVWGGTENQYHDGGTRRRRGR